MENKTQIFLWHGENNFEIMERLRLWKETFSAKHSAFNIFSFNLSQDKTKKDFWEQIKSGLQSDSLFGANKLLVLRGFLDKEEKTNEEGMKMLAQTLPKLPAGFFVIFIEKNISKTNKLFKAIEKLEESGRAQIAQFGVPIGSGLIKWIIARAQKNGANLKDQSANLLLSLIGADLHRLNIEIEKLSAYKKDQEILPADISALVSGRYNDSIFALLDAISAKNKKQALLQFGELLNSGSSDLYILSMLIRQFRILLSLKALGQGGSLSDQLAVKELGLHPFEAKKAIVCLNRFNEKEIKAIYEKLFEFDIKLKSSVVNFELLFDLLVADLQ